MTLCTWALIFYVGGTFGDPFFTLTLFSLCGMLIWGSKAVYLIRASGAGYRDSAFSLFRHLLLSVIVSLPLMFAVYMGLPLLILFGVAGITTVVYYLLLFFTDTLIRRELMEMLQGTIPMKYIDWRE